MRRPVSRPRRPAEHPRWQLSTPFHNGLSRLETRRNWVLLGFTGFYWVLLGFTGFWKKIMECNWMFTVFFLIGNGSPWNGEMVLRVRRVRRDIPGTNRWKMEGNSPNGFHAPGPTHSFSFLFRSFCFCWTRGTFLLVPLWFSARLLLVFARWHSFSICAVPNVTPSIPSWWFVPHESALFGISYRSKNSFDSFCKDALVFWWPEPSLTGLLPSALGWNWCEAFFFYRVFLTDWTRLATVVHLILLGFPGLNWIRLDFTGLYRVLTGSTWFCRVSTSPHELDWVFPSFTWFY